MPEHRVSIQYTVQEVTSAQRTRLLRSGQFKLIIFFGVISVLVLALHMLFPQTFHIIAGVTWTQVWQIALAYFASLLGITLIVPWISFHLTRFWKLPLIFQFGQKGMRLGVAGKSGGLRLGWEQVLRVEENRLVFMVYYEDGQKHFLLPKASFSEAAEAHFRRLLARHPGDGSAAGKSQPAAGNPQPAGEEDQ